MLPGVFVGLWHLHNRIPIKVIWRTRFNHDIPECEINWYCVKGLRVPLFGIHRLHWYTLVYICRSALIVDRAATVQRHCSVTTLHQWCELNCWWQLPIGVIPPYSKTSSRSRCTASQPMEWDCKRLSRPNCNYSHSPHPQLHVGQVVNRYICKKISQSCRLCLRRHWTSWGYVQYYSTFPIMGTPKKTNI